MPPLAMALTVVLDWLPDALSAAGGVALRFPSGVARPAGLLPVPSVVVWPVRLWPMLPSPAPRLVLVALNVSRLAISEAVSVPVVSWLFAASAVLAMTAPLRSVAPATRMPKPSSPARMPAWVSTLAKSPDCLPTLRLPLAETWPANVTETLTPALLSLDAKVDVSWRLAMARLPASIWTRLPESVAPSRVSAPAAEAFSPERPPRPPTTAVPPAESVASRLVTSVPEKLPLLPDMPKLTEGTPVFSLPFSSPTLAETPRLTPKDEDLPLLVSVSRAASKVIGPFPRTVRLLVAETSLPMTLTAPALPAPDAMMLTSLPETEDAMMV